MASAAAPSAQCQVCSAPTGDKANLCRTHSDQLVHDLRTVAAIVVELEVTVTRQDRVGPAKHGSRSAETPLAWNENAAAREFELNTTINAWALDVSHLDEDERDPLADISHTDTADVAAWLTRNISTLRQHGEAGTAYDEITDAVHNARDATDLPKVRNRFYAGPCPNQLVVQNDDGTEGRTQCQGEVWAFIATGNDMSYLRCQSCRASWDTTQWIRVGREMLARVDQINRAAKLRSATEKSPGACLSQQGTGAVDYQGADSAQSYGRMPLHAPHEARTRTPSWLPHVQLRHPGPGHGPAAHRLSRP
jgi:hypothetical protein